MERRTFLKRVAELSVGVISAGSIATGCSSGIGHRIEVGAERQRPVPVKQLENDYIRFLFYSDASADVVDKTTQTGWRMAPVALQETGAIDEGHVWLRTSRSICEQYPGRFVGEKVGQAVRFVLLGRQDRVMGTFVCEAGLDGKWLEFVIKDVDEGLASLVFPPAIESESLVFPRKLGQWVRRPLDGRYFWTFFSHLNMRWFGGLKGDAGWMAVFNREFADAGVMATEMSASPGWLKSLGRWRYPRTIRYRFTQGGYVGMAKVYRRWAIENGLHKSIKEKMEQVPAIQNLAGGRFFSLVQACTPIRREYFENRLKPYDEGMLRDKAVSNISHAEAAELIQDVQRLGMKRGLVLLRGWINGGYDWSHPDVWPTERVLGSVDELRALCSMEGPIVVGLHDNYQDIYEHCESFPRGVNWLADGRLMPGGYWAGGQAYIINSRDSVKYAKRNWEQIKILRPRMVFIDTTTVVQAYESYETGNTLTRSQDIECKAELLKFFKRQGVILGSEGGADFGMAYIDYAEAWHRRTAGESIPIWPLVYGDAAFVTRLRDNSFCVVMNWPQTEYPWWLEDMLWGYMAYFGVDNADELKMREDEFKSTLHVDKWHNRVGGQVMTGHRFLTDDFAVEETRFANGLGIVVNFEREERVVDAVRVPGYGYVVRE